MLRSTFVAFPGRHADFQEYCLTQYELTALYACAGCLQTFIGRFACCSGIRVGDLLASCRPALPVVVVGVFVSFFLLMLRHVYLRVTLLTVCIRVLWECGVLCSMRRSQSIRSQHSMHQRGSSSGMYGSFAKPKRRGSGASGRSKQSDRSGSGSGRSARHMEDEDGLIGQVSATDPLYAVQHTTVFV